MTTTAPDHAPKYAQLSLSDKLGKAMPLLLVPVLVVFGFLSIGSTSSWLTLTVSGLAMGMMIFYTAAGVKVLHYFLSRGIESRTQAWRVAVAN